MAARSPERGFGAAYLLILLSIAALLLAGVAERGGLGLERSTFEVEREQARYLALAGAEHAVWRTAGDPCFLAAHAGETFTGSRSTGSYTYRVTGTSTRTTIAATGSAGSARFEIQREVERRREPAVAMLAYGEDADAPPPIRVFQGGAWGGAAATATVARRPAWCVLRGCPTRRERLLATLDDNKKLTLQVWNGTTWTLLTTITTENQNTKCFGLAYEARSGDALFVYARSNDGDLYFRAWNGTTLGGEQRLDLPFNDRVEVATLVPHAGTDEIAAMAFGGDKSLVAAIWNGSTFSTTRVLDTALHRDDFECGAATFLDPSGTALFVWSGKLLGDSMLKQILWRDAWTVPVALPLGTEEARWLKIAAQPGVVGAVVVWVDKSARLKSVGWSGLGFDVVATVLAASVPSADTRCFDLTFNALGSGLLAYAEAGDARPKLRTWAAGTGWSAATAGPDLAGDLFWLQLRPDPALDLTHVAVLAAPKSGPGPCLDLCTWTGSWTTKLDVRPVSSKSREGFMVCPEGAACPQGIVAVLP